MDFPDADIEGCAGAHRRLREILDEIGDADISAPTRLSGWTVAHVLSHLARNAEAMCVRIEAAAQGELVDQYAGGAAGREEAIAEGAARPASAIAEDVRRWSDRLDELFGNLPAEVWARPVRTVAGGEHPVALLPFRRWREVEVHLVDLDRGYAPADWSEDFVARVLPRLLDGVADRTDQRELTAWLFGRGPAPDLRPWA